MNAEHLLAHYERIADAPDAISRLRRFILDLAVRGKLVPQEATDEQASELLKRLKKARSDLEAAGRIRKEKGDAPAHYGGEQDFELPRTWAWARLFEIGQTQTGTSPSSANPDLFGDFIPFIKPADLDGNQINYDGPGLSELGIEHSRLAAANSILMVCIGATLGKVNTTSRSVCFNQQINSVTPFLDGLTSFIALALKASGFQALAWSKAGTGTLPIISKGKWEQLPIPLAPLAEQHRIVAKVDELMALCDRLEAARAAREERRDRLAAASLARLNVPDSKTFQGDARFALDALPAFTTRPDQIEQLRQTILNLAVRGKLVPQDPKDEPASELLKRIAAEKARLARAGQIREEKQLPEIKPEQAPFGLPVGWAWTRLGSAAVIVQGFAFSSGDFSNDRSVGYPLIKIGDIGSNAPDTFINGRPDLAYLVKPGDILLGLSGSIKCSIWKGPEALLNQRIARITPPSNDVHSVWLLFAVDACIDKWKDETSKLTVQNIKAAQLYESVVPLPPLAEQKRIVAKVDELMALCDRLEANLAAADDTRRRLLDALLHEALAPAEEREQAA